MLLQNLAAALDGFRKFGNALIAPLLQTLFSVEQLSKNLEQNIQAIKKILQAEDILVYRFSPPKTEQKQGDEGTVYAIIYADGVVDKALLGDLAARPLNKLDFSKEAKPTLEEVKRALLFPELKEDNSVEALTKEILDGNSVLLVDGLDQAIIVGAKMPPSRAVIEPPTDVAVKGPREGFVEDVKTNMALLRKRLKTPALRFTMLKIGKQSDTNVAVCYLDGIADAAVKDELIQKLEAIQTDVIPDSSYVATLIAPRPHSVFRQSGTTEKPDILAAKMSEGRIGILVDGSPIALTVPYILAEDLQSSEDYFVSPFVATVTRLLRVFAVLVAILLPAFYVSTQLFKIQLLPLSLTLTIASSIQGLPLSPSLEMFLVLLVLEILKEASIRMPKYVGMSLSVVGALVLGETAVSAGFVSTPAIIVVAFSGICLYTVPNFTETGSLLRWFLLIVSGSIGPFGIVLAAAFLLYYLLSADAFGSPPLAPFSPLVRHDLKDSAIKSSLFALNERPALFRSPNRTRLTTENKKSEQKSNRKTKEKNKQKQGD